ncbi:hypothetical protein D3C84_1200830 [compost metagenome]
MAFQHVALDDSERVDRAADGCDDRPYFESGRRLKHDDSRGSQYKNSADARKHGAAEDDAEGNEEIDGGFLHE